MKNKKTMIVKIDWKEQKILNENLDIFVNECIKRDIDFELVFIDEDYVIDSNINIIVNKYIEDCKKEKKPLAVFSQFITLFIQNIIKLFCEREAIDSEKYVSIDILTPNKNYFIVDIPKENISKEKQENLLHLGPDYLKGSLPVETIFNYILAPFYYFLYKNNLLDNEEYNDLANYMYGLH